MMRSGPAVCRWRLIFWAVVAGTLLGGASGLAGSCSLVAFGGGGSFHPPSISSRPGTSSSSLLSFRPPSLESATRRTLRSPRLLAGKLSSGGDDVNVEAAASTPSGRTRRSWLVRSVPRALSVSVMALGGAALWSRRPAWAGGSIPKSRTDGYAVQKSDDEWRGALSPMQYYVLREGGTERPYYSVLEGEDRPGVFACAGCGTPLFDAKDKFHSGTGWPSFARALPGVEVQRVDPVSRQLLGAELRCGTCGGHLGDVFSDGFLFVGTEAEKTGTRFCIDGAALVFHPTGEDDDDAGSSSNTVGSLRPVRGDEMSAQMKRKRKRSA